MFSYMFPFLLRWWMFVCICHLHSVPKEARRGSSVGSLGDGVTGACKPPDPVAWEPNSSPLKEQQALFSSPPSLHPNRQLLIPMLRSSRKLFLNQHRVCFILTHTEILFCSEESWLPLSGVWKSSMDCRRQECRDFTCLCVVPTVSWNCGSF